MSAPPVSVNLGKKFDEIRIVLAESSIAPTRDDSLQRADDPTQFDERPDP